MIIRDAVLEDSPKIAEIYNFYVANTCITFEETEVSSEEMSKRLRKVSESTLPWIVAVEDEAVIGYAYATKWKERTAYRFSVESTIYLSNEAQGKGLGTELYEVLLDKLKLLGINSVIGGITLPNSASVGLHEKLGMKKVAHFPKVGFKFGEWLDVGYWQLSLHN
ncbi:arsinothricin resistance N-acetyltransferase ArsN1 family B [Alteromonas sp. CI.11.F.A3]|uniref:arsinothricin resistance N-acetyltransferase ArsN1 family B n=1 Tax=unclassified Alteromonas TaxID=2614992 RepID=UPI001FFD91D6|nr:MULTISPECIES: arsinothricin resistance N-acetyltransferase ArsN1 family B [unclassified Alteromonas]WOI38950.1 arsinothricin resistance N-acetyltransferase ArsN1 family B [Alteromonas sp. CI.11.F.A3]